MRQEKRNQGFTLIELLIVIAIIGILAAVLIPNLLDARARSFDTAAQSCARELATAQEVVMVDTQAYGEVGTDTIPACADVDVDGGAAEGGASYSYTTSHPNGSGATFTVAPDTGVTRNAAP